MYKQPNNIIFEEEEEYNINNEEEMKSNKSDNDDDCSVVDIDDIDENENTPMGVAKMFYLNCMLLNDFGNETDEPDEDIKYDAFYHNGRYYTDNGCCVIPEGSIQLTELNRDAEIWDEAKNWYSEFIYNYT